MADDDGRILLFLWFYPGHARICSGLHFTFSRRCLFAVVVFRDQMKRRGGLAERCIHYYSDYCTKAAGRELSGCLPRPFIHGCIAAQLARRPCWVSGRKSILVVLKILDFGGDDSCQQWWGGGCVDCE
jgi:hypothetical protein